MKRSKKDKWPIYNSALQYPTVNMIKSNEWGVQNDHIKQLLLHFIVNKGLKTIFRPIWFSRLNPKMI